MNAPIVSTELRDQFNALKALIDALTATQAPIGVMLPWCKSLSGVPALPANFVECNGQVLSDAGSPLNGITLPDPNGVLSGVPQFLRGASTSGGTGGSETHGHAVSYVNVTDVTYESASGYTAVQNGGLDIQPGSTLPSYYEVVWVMRIK